MNKTHNIFDFLVGTIVLIIAIIFFSLSLKNSKISSQDGYYITAKFENADGINIGSDIKISGVKIGSVTKQILDPSSFRAILTFNIQNSINLPIDSSAKIVSEGLLGSKYISITPGGDEKNISNGQEIAFTQSSINFEELLGKFIFNGKGNDEKK